MAVNASTLAVTRRYYDPYGNPVGTPAPSWPGTKGFVGCTADPVTTLDDLGAREYQPATGAFTSPDPVLSPYDPQDLNPYAYAYDNPATDADPTGLLASYGDPGSGVGCTGTAQSCSPILTRQQNNNGSGDGSNSGGTATGGGSGTSGSGGGCGILSCLLDGAKDVVGGVGNGIADTATSGLRAIGSFYTGFANGMPTGNTSNGEFLYGNDATDPVPLSPLPMGDRGAILYDIGYYGWGFLSGGAGAGAEADAGDLGPEIKAGSSGGPTAGEETGSALRTVEIVGPKEFDPSSLEGLTSSEVRASIPSDWVAGASKSGGGRSSVTPPTLVGR